MTTLRIPTPLQPYTLGNQMVIVKGKTVGEAMADLVVQYPSIKQHLFNDSDELRPFVNIFLGEEEIRHLQGMDTPLSMGDKLMIIPSIAGGRNWRDAQHQWFPPNLINISHCYFT